MINKKTLIGYGIFFIAVQLLMGLKIFVTFPEMTAYAVSKDNMQIVIDRLIRIEDKLDKLGGF